MSSKAKNKRNSPSIIKNGTATSILSACDKPFIADNLTDYRDKYERLKIDNGKLEQKLKASEQDSKEKLRLIAEVQKKNEIITKHLTTITQRDNQIKLLKETSVDRGDAQRLEGFIKKKDHEIEELKKQIDSTKINAVASLENKICLQREQIKTLDQYRKVNLNGKKQLSDRVNQLIKENEYLKEGYGKFNVVDESLKEENEKLKEENTQLKKDIETLKGEHGEIIQKLDKIQNGITLLYDDF